MTIFAENYPNHMKRYTLMASAMPTAVAIAYIFWQGVAINWLYALAALVVMIVLQVCVNLTGLKVPGVFRFALYAVAPAVALTWILSGSIDWNVLWAAATAGLIYNGNVGIWTKSPENNIPAWIYIIRVMAPFPIVALCSFFGILPLSTIIVFMTLPVAIACAKTMKNSIKGGRAMIADLDARTSNLQMLFSVLLVISLVVDVLV